MTWLGWLNILIIQWFFIRLARVLDDNGNTIKFKIIGIIVPVTGWFSDYIYVYKIRGKE
jgi:hypothetical protein